MVTTVIEKPNTINVQQDHGEAPVSDSAATTTTLMEQLTQPTCYVSVGIVKHILHRSRYPKLRDILKFVLCSNENQMSSWLPVWERACLNEWRHLSHNNVCELMRTSHRILAIPLPSSPDYRVRAVTIANGVEADLLSIDLKEQCLCKHRVTDQGEIKEVQRIPLSELHKGQDLLPHR